MSLNDQIQGMQTGGGGRGFIFRENVKVKYMTGKDPIVFRMLPAFDPNNTDPSTSVLPFAMPDGTITDWGILLYISRFVGHGRGGFGTRQDLISLRSFAQGDAEVFCPLEQLMKTINAMTAEWGYLINDQGEGSSRQRKAFSKPMPHFIANIWDLNQPMVPAQVGMFTSSASRALTDPKSGLIFQRTNLPEEVIQQNYLLAYQVGDLTDPTNGPALVCVKGNENGEFSKYRVTLATNTQGQVVKRPVGPEVLQTRYNMSQPNTFIEMPTEESLINGLIQLLNMRSPQGYHEYALLKQAFPQFRIPDPPAAPAATPTVPTGFGGVPAPAPASAPVDVTPQVGGPVSQGTTAAPAPFVPAPTAVPLGPAPQTAAVPPQTAPQAPTAVPAGTQVPQAPTAAPAAFQAVPAAPQPAPAPAEAQGAVQNMQAAQAGPVAPGDPVPTEGQKWDRDSFMQRLKSGG
jgi:hypothetical protein